MRTLDIEKLTRFFLAVTLIMPLVFVPSSFIFPFIVPKILFFRSMTFFGVGGYLLLLAADWKRYKPSKDPITAVVFLFLLSFGISSFIGVDWYRSLWDSHERMLGFFTLMHYGLFFLVLTRVVHTWKEWRFLLRMLLGAGILVMLLGVWQQYIDPQVLLNRGSNRVSATLGNAIYFSGFGFYLFATGILLALKEKMKSGWWWFSAVGSGLGFFGIFLGGTRGTFLGLLVAVSASLLVMLLTKQGSATLRRNAAIGLISLVIVCGLLVIFRDSALIRSIPTVNRLSDITSERISENTRIMAWQIAGIAWQEKPVFGWGPNNYYYAFNQYYNPIFLRYGLTETWFDNAHSALLNTLAVQGIVGAILYLGLFVVPMYMLYAAWKKEKIDFSFALVSFGFLLGHFVHNMVVFENPVSYMYFFFFLAFVVQQTKSTEDPVLQSNAQQVPSTTIAIVLCAVLLFVYVTNINPARANTAALRMVIAAQTNVADVLPWFDRATLIPTPHIDDIRMDFARNAPSAVQLYLQNNQQEDALTATDAAIIALEKNIALHPLDIRFHLTYAELLKIKGLLINDNSYLLQAEEVLNQALTLSPKRQQLMYNLAEIKQRLGKPEEAKELYERAINDYDEIAESWWRLALLYVEQQDREKAIQIIEEAKERGARFKKADNQIVEQYINPQPLNIRLEDGTTVTE